MKQIIYKLLEGIFKNGIKTKISGISLKLPFRFYRYYESDYEIENVSFFKKHVKQKDTVIDIGAQIGLMTKLFADLVGKNGKVYSFEPTPKTFSVLKETIKINDIEKIVFPIQQAVSDKKGTAIFNISDVDIDAANSLSNSARNHATSGIEVNITSVDEFVKDMSISKINFLKIDAEGAEYYVLLGAENTIEKHKPILNLALHPMALIDFNSSLSLIFDFIKNKKYKIIYRSDEMSESVFINKRDLFDVQLIPITN
ncbi:MAG: FkbM family methyltransferase [Bacteroidota bacterium]